METKEPIVNRQLSLCIGLITDVERENLVKNTHQAPLLYLLSFLGSKPVFLSTFIVMILVIHLIISMLTTQ